MKPAQQLAQALRKMAAEFPTTDEEQRTLKDAAGMLEWVLEHVADMEQKGAACKRMACERQDAHKAVLAAKASTYDEEARRLREILGKTEAVQSQDFDDEPTKERKR